MAAALSGLLLQSHGGAVTQPAGYSPTPFCCLFLSTPTSHVLITSHLHSEISVLIQGYVRKFPEACRAGAVTLGRGVPTEGLPPHGEAPRGFTWTACWEPSHGWMGWMRRGSPPCLTWGHGAKIHLSLPAFPDSHPRSPPRELGAQACYE